MCWSTLTASDFSFLNVWMFTVGRSQTLPGGRVQPEGRVQETASGCGHHLPSFLSAGTSAITSHQLVTPLKVLPPPFDTQYQWPAAHLPVMLLPSMSFLSPLVYSSAPIVLVPRVPSGLLSSFSRVLYPVTAGCNPCASRWVVLLFLSRVLCASHNCLLVIAC